MGKGLSELMPDVIAPGNLSKQWRRSMAEKGPSSVSEGSIAKRGSMWGVARQAVTEVGKAHTTALGLAPTTHIAFMAVAFLVTVVTIPLGGAIICRGDTTLGFVALVVAIVALTAAMLLVFFLKAQSGGSTSPGANDDEALEAIGESNYQHTERRTEAFVGKWCGNLKQQFRGQWIIAAIEMEFKTEQNAIGGEITLDHPEGTSNPRLHLQVCSSFFYDPFIKLDYKNKENTVLQFGCWIGRLNAEGTQLKGRYVGYGAVSNRIVTGDVSVEKVT
jgi:hypothetical protein